MPLVFKKLALAYSPTKQAVLIQHQIHSSFTDQLPDSHMPQRLTQEIITAAIAGYEAQRRNIDSKIAELRNMLHRGHAAAPAGPSKPKRKISLASRRRMASAQKKRWAAIKGHPQASSPAAAHRPKRRISEEGMKRIIAATKKRWALIRAREAKANRAVAKMPPGKKAAMPKAA